MTQTWYQILEVSKTASTEQIKASYKKLALQYLPDKNPGIDDTKCKLINEANRILSDPDLRSDYDYELKHGTPRLITGRTGTKNPEDFVAECRKRQTELRANLKKRTFEEQEQIDEASKAKRCAAALKKTAQTKIEHEVFLKLEAWQRETGQVFPFDEYPEFDVESILDEKNENGITYYLVKWLGFTSEHNSWEPSQNLSCPERIREFEFENSKTAKTVPAGDRAAANVANSEASEKNRRHGGCGYNTGDHMPHDNTFTVEDIDRNASSNKANSLGSIPKQYPRRTCETVFIRKDSLIKHPQKH